MRFELGPYHIEVATDFGPRITSLRVEDGPEMFAELDPDLGLGPDGRRFRFRGGHRLWASPEVADVTYAPDDHPCQVEEREGVVSVLPPPDAAGLIKEISLGLDGAELVVSHRLTRANGHAPPLAPWAITQLPLGGTAILPMVGADTAPSANRYLVLWPYSSLEDGRVSLGEDAMELSAVDGPEIKFGIGPDPGRLGYFKDDFLFVKQIEPASDRTVPDFGAVGQVYVGQGFCELESVGGLADLSDGKSAGLTERWAVVDCDDLDSAISITTGT